MTHTATAARGSSAVRLGAAAALCVLVFATYHAVRSFSFVNFDDSEYVYANAAVAAGISLENVRWAFTNFHSANWHPFTWLSHMADVDAFGMRPGAHHMVNVAFHAVNAVLLFLVLASATGAPLRSWFVAALFSVHPLNVESVAWISERKNVLSMMFLLLTIASYVAWTRRPTLSRYLSALVLFAFALLSKPIVVTGPILLLLLDVWPLSRIELPRNASAIRAFASRALVLVREKLPFFGCAAICAAVTYAAQQSWNATISIPIEQRVFNAAGSVAWYIAKTLWPSDLSVFYPHPASIGETVPARAFIASALLIVVLTGFAIRIAHRRPYVLVGWMWFLVALLPVIGLVQAGLQAHADRYAYFAIIGVLFAVTWAFTDLPLSRTTQGAFAGVAMIAIGAAAIASKHQISYWRDNETLYVRAIRVNPQNWLAWNNLGTDYLDTNRPASALPCFVRASTIKRDYGDVYYNAGVALARMHRGGEAILWYMQAVEIDESNADAWINLGIEFLNREDFERAIASYRRGLDLREDDAAALYGLTLAHLARRESAPASAYFVRLQQADPALAADVKRQIAATAH